MVNPIDPCFIFEPAETPGTSNIINGGAVVTPEDDGEEIVIRRYPTRPRYPEVEPPQTGDGEGSGETDSDPPVINPEDYQYENYPESDLGTLILDNRYFPVVENTPTYTPKASNFPQIEILAPEIDTSIFSLTEQSDLSLSGINNSITNLQDQFIKKSIKEELKNILYGLYLPDGRRAGETVINKAIRVRTLNNTLGNVNQRYALNLAIRAAIAQVTTSTQVASAILTATYGKTIKQIIESRVNNLLKFNQTTSNLTVITPDINRAVDRVESKKISLDPSTYTTEEVDLLKLWYILPEDIYAKVPIVDSSGNSIRLKIPNSEKLAVLTSSLQATSVNVLEYGYDTCVITESGHELVPTDDQLSRAYTINNNTEQACLFDAQARYNVTLTVSSPLASNLELTYDLTAARPSQYVLLINKDTIEDVPFDGSPFVRKTKAEYTIQSDPEVIQQNIEFRPYPWLVLPVDHNDPILGHFSSSSHYTIQFTNFSLEEFGDDATGPILVRKVPKCIILQPTDRYDLLFYSGYSSLVDWNVRTLNYTLSPDPNYYNPKLKDHYFASIELAYPNIDITGDYTEHGMRAVFSSATATAENLFISGSEPERTAHGFRAAVNIASALNNIYYVNEGLLWTDVYKRLTLKQYYTIKMGIPNYMLDRLRLGHKTNIKLFHNKNDYYGVTNRLGQLKPGKVDNLPIYLNI